ncbi:MAG: Ku protein [Acidobacteriaceae bacterium]|nr:Ku protein [Acidobacteriaceae bacterium]
MAATVWRGYITFGLISIPVRLFRAARPERVGLRRLYRPEPPVTSPEPELPPEPISRSEQRFQGAGSAHRLPLQESASRTAAAVPALAPIQQVSVKKGSDDVLAERSIVKGYEYEKGRYVAIEPEELKSLAPKTSAGMEIQEFVELAEIDPVYFETSYYVTPEEAGEKAYALLYRSMQTTGLVAVAQFAMHSREHVVIVRPGKSGLLAHTMFFASEVRGDEEYHTDVSAVADKELDLAQMLIRSLAAPFEPVKYRDTYRERLESIIAKKVQGQPITPTELPQRPADVIDIADALRKSLANLKKPAASEQPAKPEPSSSGRAKGASRGAGRK